MKKNAFYAQSGGVTSVINATAAALILEAKKHQSKIGKVYAGNLSTYEKVYAKAWDSSAANYTKAYIGPVEGARAFAGQVAYTQSISFISSGLKVPYMIIAPYEGSFTGTYTRLYTKTYTKLWNAYAQDYTKDYEGSWTGTYSRTFYGPSDAHLVLDGSSDSIDLEDATGTGRIALNGTDG